MQNNRYYCMRHGRSEANLAGLIVSSPEEGRARWGLAAQGRRELLDALENHPLVTGAVLGKDTRLICSPFLRAVQTAEVARAVLDCGPPRLDGRLRERWFGELEGRPDSLYAAVWKKDRNDIHNTTHGVESVMEVFERMRGLVEHCEGTMRGETVLLVSHGDPLDILLCGFEGRPLSRHMEAGLKTGGIRHLL